MANESPIRKLKLGIVGIGVGASEILPAMEQIPEFELAAAADVNPRVLETFRERYGAKTYDSVEKLMRRSQRRGGLDIDAQSISRRRTRSLPPTPASMSWSKSRWRSRSKKPKK